MRKLNLRLAAFALAAAAVAVAGPARAQDDMGSNPITELFDAFGLGDKEKPEIDYRERAALVPPPSVGQLPPPQQKGAVGQATGQWPLDPDEERRARQRAEADLPRTEQRSYRMDRNPRLSPDEIIGRRTADREGAAVGGYAPTMGDNVSPRLSPDELRGKRPYTPPSAAAAGVPGVEPNRARLTDPPPGYRAPTATGPYAAAPAPAEKPWYKKLNPFSSN